MFIAAIAWKWWQKLSGCHWKLVSSRWKMQFIFLRKMRWHTQQLSIKRIVREIFFKKTFISIKHDHHLLGLRIWHLIFFYQLFIMMSLIFRINSRSQGFKVIIKTNENEPILSFSKFLLPNRHLLWMFYEPNSKAAITLKDSEKNNEK